MAFRKKAEYILSEKPDILIVPESESPEKLIFKKGQIQPNAVFWFGDNPHKGLGVFSYSDFKISLLENHNTDFRFVVPLRLKNKDFEFVLLALWCQKPNNNDNYGSQAWNAIKYYQDLLKSEKVILAGDFNSNTIWDKVNREANHSNMVDKLMEIGIQSTYHKFFNQAQGEESKPTFFLYKKLEKPYHLDYCFASDFFIKRLKKVSVGNHKKWTKHSDHSPVIVDFEIED